MRAFVLTGLLVFSAPLLAQLSFPVERPTFEVGDRWKLATLDGLSKVQSGTSVEVVEGVGESLVLVAQTRTDGSAWKIHLDLSGNRVNDVKGKQEREDKLSFPLEADKSWDSSWNWINSNGREGRLEFKYSVQGTEKVTVKAGSFDTVVIRGQGKWINRSTGASGIATEVIYYAPQAKRIVLRTWVTRFASGAADQNLIFEALEVAVKP